MFCKNCGMPVDAQKDICPHCGTRLRELHPTGDASSTGFAVLCFFFPLSD